MNIVHIIVSFSLSIGFIVNALTIGWIAAKEEESGIVTGNITHLCWLELSLWIAMLLCILVG